MQIEIDKDQNVSDLPQSNISTIKETTYAFSAQKKSHF